MEVTEAVEELRRATSIVVVTARVQATEGVESLKRVTSVAVAAARVPWMVLEEEEASVPPVTRASRAGALPRAAAAAQGRREVAVHRVAVVAEVIKVVEDLKRATPVVPGEKRAL